MITRPFFLFFVLSLFVAAGQADTPFLVKDINPTSLPFGSRPEELTASGGYVFFVASTPATDRELWRTDGTPDGTILLKDIRAGAWESGVDALSDVNGTLFFSAGEGIHGKELWRSDGTPEGTLLVKDIDPNGSSFPTPVVAHGTKGYFFTGESLWQTDGTEAGTTLISSGKWLGSSISMTSNGSAVFFTASNSGPNGYELWTSDGTDAGTRQMKDILPGPIGSMYRTTEIAAMNGVVYFGANSGSHVSLWRSDGSPEGTNPIREFHCPYPTAGLSNLVVAENILFFRACDQFTGEELWRSDGTETGTFIVDIPPGGSLSSAGSEPSRPHAFGSRVYFSAVTPENGRELWTSDGTLASTFLVRDITPGQDSSFPDHYGTIRFAEMGSFLYFSSVSGIWRTDGTYEGTTQVSSMATKDLTSTGHKLVFSRGEVVTGEELWESDGTETGTKILKDIFPATEGSLPRALTSAFGRLFFLANDGTSDGLYQTDGSVEGTDLVKGPLRFENPALMLCGGRLFFGTVHPIALWQSDGTESGTSIVDDVYPFALSCVDGRAHYAVANANAPYHVDIRSTDGTLIKTRPTTLTSVVELASFGDGRLLIAGADNSDQTQIFIADRAGNGMTRLAETTLSLRTPVSFTRIGRRIFFAATSDGHASLWVTDGTSFGTREVRQFDLDDSPPFSLTSFNGLLYFIVSGDIEGPGLWRSDGTEAGTVKVAGAVIANGYRPHPTVLGDALYFISHESGVSVLRKTDGTPGASSIIHSVSVGSGIANLSAAAGRLYFAGAGYHDQYSYYHGLEPWISDGKPGSATLLADLSPGPGESFPESFVHAGRHVFFTAHEPSVGRELFAVRLEIRPGDTNGDGSLEVSDIFYLINHLFAAGPVPIGSGDVNGDRAVNVDDIFYLINHFFTGGAAPVG